MLGYLSRAVPLEKLAVTGDAAEFTARVRDIRLFALETLGLADTKNYTRYVSIDRDYLALVVSAAAKDSFTRHEWWFPVVGRMPYKGFFNRDGARKEAEKLTKKDLDVWVRPVDAFSTLGWFHDPLYSYMRDYPVHRLADLLIHELLHATVYLKNHSQFDEELAELVGTEGARRYIETRYGADSPEYRAMTDSEADSAVFLSYIAELTTELETVYQQEIPRAEKLVLKAETIAAFQRRFAAEYDGRFSSENYRGFADLGINNAYLELYRLYYGESRFFRNLYERSGRDLPAFIAAAKRLGGKADPKRELVELLGVEGE
jgi:predicted aminopeptidase